MELQRDKRDDDVDCLTSVETWPPTSSGRFFQVLLLRSKQEFRLSAGDSMKSLRRTKDLERYCIDVGALATSLDYQDEVKIAIVILYALRGNRTPGGSMATTQVTTTPLMRQYLNSPL